MTLARQYMQCFTFLIQMFVHVIHLLLYASYNINAHYEISGKRLSGKVAIVTGASSGIGEAIAKGLASEGVKVALAARRIDRLESLQKQIEDDGGIAVCIKTDVTKREEVRCQVLV